MSQKTKINNKQLESAKEYLDALQERCSKLNIVRVDLAYKKPYSDDMSLEALNKDIGHLLSNRRTKPSIFEHNVGYILKKEHTKDKGTHIHAMFMYDGQKVQKDAYKGDQISKYWQEVITKGKGSSFNCNREKYKANGIGMLDHKDSEKRKILDEDVLPYLCKDEQDITPMKNNKREKAFSRGLLPKKKSNKGRPRE